MPLFRIMGGDRDARSTGSSGGGANRGTPLRSGGDDDPRSADATLPSFPGSASSSRRMRTTPTSTASTSTYPGLRAAASQSSPTTTRMTVGGPDAASSLSAVSAPPILAPPASAPPPPTAPSAAAPNPILRGSAVPQQPPTTLNSSTTSNRSSVTSTSSAASSTTTAAPRGSMASSSGTQQPRGSVTRRTTTTTTYSAPGRSSQSPSTPSSAPNRGGPTGAPSPAGANAPPQVTRPGAYLVTRSMAAAQGRPAQVYRVTVPAGVGPGQEFTVHAGPRRVRVRCPPVSRAGQSLQITLPPEPVTQLHLVTAAPLTSADMEEGTGGEAEQSSAPASQSMAAGGARPPPSTSGVGGSNSVSRSGVSTGGHVPMTPAVRRVNQAATLVGGTAQTFLVTIPPNIFPGMQFTVNVGGGAAVGASGGSSGHHQQRFMVTCPPNAGPGQKVRIVPPTPTNPADQEPTAAPKTQVFEVAVPQGVQPGQPFALVANGQRVLVTCPPTVRPGQKIRFQLPVHQIVQHIALEYEGLAFSGWKRTIRVSDLKFQWVRIDNKNSNQSSRNLNDPAAAAVPSKDALEPQPLMDASSASLDAGVVENVTQFDFTKSAYCRELTFLEGNDARMRTGTLELVLADKSVVDSRLVVHNRTLLSYADIAATQGKTLEQKTTWFQGICQQLTTPWEDGHVKIVVRRRHLLLDSMEAVMALSREDLWKRWRIEFLGEPAIDAGGVTREWFELVTQQIFDPDFGLWISSRNNQACCDINTASGILCPDDHLIYFRFLGRVIGRALFDGQVIKGHMVRSIYKHLLGWPITFEDIENQDEEYYNSLKKLTKMDDISLMCLDFTVTEDNMGANQEVELVKGGSMKEVTKENLSDYLEANLRYRMLDRNKLQLTELLLGFYDVIPEPALTVFDSNELELILCGLPTIDMQDWEENTMYSGLYEGKGKSDRVVQWFWEIVEQDFDQEMRARLLQFVTGTSGVPARGFSVLQGVDGNIKLFTIHGVDHLMYVYPRAHTCFNRIDLPNYNSKKELYENLKIAITMSGVGFGIE